MAYLLGIDVGSTTVKTVVLDERTGAVCAEPYRTTKIRASVGAKNKGMRSGNGSFSDLTAYSHRATYAAANSHVNVVLHSCKNFSR